MNRSKSVFLAGFKDGIPIGLGYFAVSFSLGIAAGAAGMSAFQGFLTSLLVNASAGEYAGFTVIAAGGTALEMILMTCVANARYLLMSCALSQRFGEKTSFIHRLIMGFFLTDEFFGITIARDGEITPAYTYGAICFAAPCWAFGTAFGIMMGNILPESVVSALSVALYGMFIAIIIPPAKKDRVILVLIVICFAASYLAGVIPGISGLSEGTRTIILTVAISALAAIFFPKKEEGGVKDA